MTNPFTSKFLFRSIYNYVNDILRPGQVSRGDKCGTEPGIGIFGRVAKVSRYFAEWQLVISGLQSNLLISVPDIQTRTYGD